MKMQLTNDKLLFWITRTFSKYYQSSSCTRWSTAVFMSILQLGLSYFYFVFDIYSDYQLTEAYREAYRDVGNYTRDMLACARASAGPSEDNYTAGASSECFRVGDLNPEKTYYVAFALTWLSMVISIVVYFLGITFFFKTENLTYKLDWFNSHSKGSERIFKIFIAIAVRLFWPIFHIYRRIRYEATSNKSNRRNNLIEFESIWIMVKSIEYGIEATIQMIIVLYILVPFYDEIHNWDFQTSVNKIAFGILHFLTGGKYKACLLEKVVGKLFMNVFGQCFSLTNLKYLKYGMSLFEHLTSLLPLLFSYIFQIIARILVLRVFFVTAELYNVASKGTTIALFFLLHFLLTLVIKVTFEVKNEEYRRLSWLNVRDMVRFLINWTSSSTLYVCANRGDV